MPAHQPVPSKKSNNKVVFWVFAILLFLIAFVAGGFFTGAKQNKSNIRSQQKIVTPTPNPTANWKVYSISKNSYIDFNCSFKYPANVSIDNALGTVPNYKNQLNWGSISLVTTESRHIFYVYFYDSIATLRDTYPDQAGNGNVTTLDGVFINESYKNIGTENIGGISFTKYFQPKTSGNIIYATENNGHIIAIMTNPLLKNSDGTIVINTSLTLSGQATDKLDDINQQIISTFKFTN